MNLRAAEPAPGILQHISTIIIKNFKGLCTKSQPARGIDMIRPVQRPWMMGKRIIHTSGSPEYKSSLNSFPAS